MNPRIIAADRARLREMMHEPPEAGERVAMWGMPGPLDVVVRQELPYLVVRPESGGDERLVFWGNVTRVDVWERRNALASPRRVNVNDRLLLVRIYRSLEKECPDRRARGELVAGLGFPQLLAVHVEARYGSLESLAGERR